MFRSGIMIGLALPPAVLALVQGETFSRSACRSSAHEGDISVCNPDIQSRIPAWDGLLQVYGALYLPLIFAILFELNLAAWVEARINYEVSFFALEEDHVPPS